MDKNELKKLFNSEKFLAGLREVDSAESLQKFLKEHHFDISVDEINKAIKSNKELSESELNKTTGGNNMNWMNVVVELMKC